MKKIPTIQQIFKRHPLTEYKFGGFFLFASDKFLPVIPKYKSENIETIKNRAKIVFDQNCKENNINDNLKPKLEIEHENKIFILNKNEEKVIEKPLDYKSINGRGQYDSETHTIKINADNCLNIDEIEATIIHELHHTKESILRNSLSQEERNNEVKSALIDNIKNGDNDHIIFSITDTSYDMINTPITKPESRTHIIDFAKKHLFSNDKELSKKLIQYYKLNYETDPSKKLSLQSTLQFNKLKVDLKDFLNDFNSLKENIKFKYEPNEKRLNKEGREKELFTYLIAIENRYQYFRKQEIQNIKYNLTDEEKTNIGKSIAANIEAVESNYALELENNLISLYIKNKDKETGNELRAFKSICNPYSNYIHSKEEVDARQKAREEIIQKLKDEELGRLKNRKEIKKLKISNRIEKMNFDLYSAGKLYRKNPTRENKKELRKASIKMNFYFFLAIVKATFTFGLLSDNYKALLSYKFCNM